MYILFEAIPAKNREFITYANKLHHSMEAGALSLGANTERLYSFRAASISNLAQPANDSSRIY